MPTPDTSPQNIARVLRDLLAQIDRMAPTLEEYDYTPEECAGKALADALDAAPAVRGTIMNTVSGALTKDEWADRLEAACVEYYPTFGTREQMRPGMDAALRKAFPELAPADD